MSNMKKYGNNIYSQTVWGSNFSVNKLMYSWMRFSGQISTNKEIMRFGDLSLYVGTNKMLFLQHGTNHISTGLSVFLNEWSLIGLRLAGTETTVFINGDSSTHVVSYNSSNVDYLTIGKHPATNQQSYLDEITPSLASCVMDILYIGLGTHHTTVDHLSSMYFEGKNYLDVDFKNTKEQVSYYNHYLYKDAEVISLNGSFTTSKSNEPTSYFYTNKDFKLDKTRLFEYDHGLQRHVYGSYRNYKNFDTLKKSKLVYQVGLGTIGSVNLFVKPSVAIGCNKRTILNFKNGTNSVLDIFMDEQNELKILVNGIQYSTNELKLTINEWQMLTVLWQTNQIQISVNNSALLVINTTTFNLEYTTLYIGSSYTNDIPDNHFEGTIQMLSIWHNHLTVQSINNLFNDGLAMIYQTEYDVNGRLKSKNLIDGEQILSKKYQYYDKIYDDNGEQKQKLNSLPTSEIDIDGTEAVYVYDEYSNVLSKEKISDSGVPFQITRYDYDVLKRLSQESVSTVTIDESDPNNPIRSEGLLYAYHYIYDSNGNITEKKKVDSNNQVDYVDTYHYSTSFKDRLENITRNDHGVTTTVYAMTYSSDEPFRPSTITENGQTKNLVWHGPKLMQYGDYEYAYNEIGLRIKKTAPGLNVAYDVDDLMIIRSIDKINDRIIDYHFDQHEQVIGFSYQGKEFLYQRDILGEIYGIIDKNGKSFVTYKYTAYGVPTIEIPNDLTTAELSLAQTIRDLNIYLYKGYVYDQETGLYYCHSRYYNPKVGRWISIDDVSYLDPESIGGMNLYAYCGNNPVMYTDPSGNFSLPNWAKWLIGGVTFASAVILTILTGGALAPMFIGMGISILLGGAIEGMIATSKGEDFWSGFIDGAADGAMWGGIFSLGTASLRTVKMLKNGVAIGENMKRVTKLAKTGHQITYKGMPGYNLLSKFGKKELARNLSMRHNQIFIERMMRWGVKVVDYGIDVNRNYRSFYYLMETIVTNGYKYLNLIV